MALRVMGEAVKIAAKIQDQDQVRVVYDIGAHAGKWTARYLPIFPKAHFYMFDAFDKRSPGTSAARSTYRAGLLAGPGMDYVDYYTRHHDLTRDVAAGTRRGSGGDSYYRELTGRFDDVQPERMPACTLDSLDLPPPQVMKLDTQGSEVDILKGAAKAMASVLMVQIEMPILPYNKGAPGFDEYMELLTSYGLVPYAVEETHLWPGVGLLQIDLIFVAKRIVKMLR